MNMAQWLERTAQINAKAPALFHGTQLVTDYAGFRARGGVGGGFDHARRRAGGSRGDLHEKLPR